MWSALKYDPRVFSISCSSAFAVAAIAIGAKRCDCSVLAISINIFTFDCQMLQANRLCVWMIHIFHPVLRVPFEPAKSCAHSSCFTPININSFIWVVIPLAGRMYFFMISHKQMHYNKIWSPPACNQQTKYTHTREWNCSIFTSIECAAISPLHALALLLTPSFRFKLCSCVTANKNEPNGVTSLSDFVWRHKNIFTLLIYCRTRNGFFLFLSLLCSRELSRVNAITTEGKTKKAGTSWTSRVFIAF